MPLQHLLTPSLCTHSLVCTFVLAPRTFTLSRSVPIPFYIRNLSIEYNANLPLSQILLLLRKFPRQLPCRTDARQQTRTFRGPIKLILTAAHVHAPALPPPTLPTLPHLAR